MTATAEVSPVMLGYRPALDGLRALAVVLVVLQHTGDFLVSQDGPRLTGGPFVPGGFLGVDLFFVLSGFLITALLLEERRDRGSVAYGAFYERRALRLLPALGVLLVSTTVYVAITDGPLRDHLRGVVAAALYVWNWAVVADVAVGDFGHGHLWSLAVEEQFYLLWPVLLMGAVALTARRPAMLAGVCLAGAALAATARWVVADGGGVGDAYVRTDTRADALLLGAAVAVAFVRRGRLPRWTATAAPVAAGSLVALAATTAFVDEWLYRGGLTVVALICAVLVSGAVVGGSVLHRVLVWPPVVRLGTLSYTLYLLHYPVFEGVHEQLGEQPALVRVGVAWGLSAMATLACHRWVERPFLHIKNRRGRARLTRPTEVHTG